MYCVLCTFTPCTDSALSKHGSADADPCQLIRFACCLPLAPHYPTPPSPTAASAAPPFRLAPGLDDPPEMELGTGSFGFVPFWYPVGGAKLAAVSTNYIPSPVAENPAVYLRPNAASSLNHSAVLPADGPVAAQEWWIATDPTGAADPTAAAAWARPYLQQTQLSGNAGVAGGAVAAPGFVVTHAPLMVAQSVRHACVPPGP